jgi:hypothetical protein
MKKLRFAMFVMVAIMAILILATPAFAGGLNPATNGRYIVRDGALVLQWDNDQASIDFLNSLDPVTGNPRGSVGVDFEFDNVGGTNFHPVATGSTETTVSNTSGEPLWYGRTYNSVVYYFFGNDAVWLSVPYVAPAYSRHATLTPEANDAGWHNTDVSVEIEMKGAIGDKVNTLYYVDLTGAPETTYTAPFVITNEGANVLVYRGVGSYNGMAYYGDSMRVYIDKTAPTLSLNSTDTYTGKAEISALAGDGGSGLELTEMRMDGGPWTTGVSISTTVPGNHIVYARATDKAGNKQVEAAKFTITPTVVPPTVYGTKLSISAASSVKHGKTYAIKSYISPNGATGTAKAVFQKKVGKVWKTYKTNYGWFGGGKFTTSYKLSSKHSYRGSWRVTVSYGGVSNPATVYKTSTTTKYFYVK